MDSLHFTVMGNPFGKQRPRAARVGRYVTVYTPKETVDYESKVRSSYLQDYRGFRIEGAVEADITAYHRIPKATSKIKREKMLKGEIPCTVKPDTDNIAKCILDPLNSIAFVDDNHVSRLLVDKKYSETPRVEVELRHYKKKAVDPFIHVNSPFIFTNLLGGIKQRYG